MAGALAGTSILLADDDADHLEILAIVFRLEGATVHVASSAHEALDVLRTVTPGLLVLDLSMPETDGFGLLSRIRGVERLRKVPAVALTAHAYKRDRDLCLDAGFAAHLGKPFDLVAIVGLASRLLATDVSGPSE